MTSNLQSVEHRRAILGALAAIAAAPLSGCATWFSRDPTPVCPQSPEVSYLAGPLTIDAHCHVFNGTDLQVKDFLSKVAIGQGGALGVGATILGSILQGLAWTFAPDGEAELKALDEVAQALKSCASTDASSKLASLRQRGYATGREQLQAALRRSDEYRPLMERFTPEALLLEADDTVKAKYEAISLIESLPQDVETYRSPVRLESLGTLSARGRSVRGMIDFVLQNFQYRYVSIHDYLRTYNQPGARVIDLMLPSMVDYDWWLSKGGATPTSLRSQIEVMARISVLTRGRVHAFVPYDPLRQVAHALGYGADDSFTLVTSAIQQSGFVGVKLYPPMGFAPLGNEGVQQSKGGDFWNRPWLAPWMARADMGRMLDDAMKKVLTWCEANAVPVMAHTNLSNGVTKEFEALAGSQYWDQALRAFPKLRVSFGHFGDTAPVEDGLSRARAFAQLMNASPKSPGAFAFADAGYFVEVMGSEPKLLENLRQLYDETAGKGEAALANRFIYGTDWEMTLTEGSVAAYLSKFVQLFDEFERSPMVRSQGLSGLSSKFFAGNAVNFLGLRKGSPTRQRLDAFYAANGVPTPDWVAKVDAA